MTLSFNNFYNNDKGLGVLYRVQSMKYRDKTELYCHTYPIVKVTPKGNWIEVFGLGLKGDRKFVNSNTRKQWASLTEKQALIAFYYRKIRQIRILESQLINTKEALVVATEELKKNGEL